MFNQGEKVLGLIGPDDRVLDIGGGQEVFPRANVVLDILPYEERLPGPLSSQAEAFTSDDWIIGDICAPEIWAKFRDREFDFVLCSHTLEDLRDPLFVCAQMIRVGKAGYIETPSRLYECARVNPRDRYSGWVHHRWIVDVIDNTIVFTPKMAWTHMFDFISDAKRPYLSYPQHTFTAVHWTGSFDFIENTAKGPPIEVENLFRFYETYPYANPPAPVRRINNVVPGPCSIRGVKEYLLPIEEELTAQEIVDRYQHRLSQSAPEPSQTKLRHRIVARLRYLAASPFRRR